MKSRFFCLLVLSAVFACGCDPDEEGSAGNGSDTGDGSTTDDGGDGSEDAGDDAADGSPSSNDGQDESDVSPEDAFCDYARDGFAALDDYTTVMNELSLTGEEVPVSRINENGELAIQFAEDFGENMNEAASFVVDEGAAQAFDTLLVYQADYMLPQAELAASATSDMQYGMDSLAFLSEDGVAETVASGATASGAAKQYAIGRCGSLD